MIELHDTCLPQYARASCTRTRKADWQLPFVPKTQTHPAVAVIARARDTRARAITVRSANRVLSMTGDDLTAGDAESGRIPSHRLSTRLKTIWRSRSKPPGFD